MYNLYSEGLSSAPSSNIIEYIKSISRFSGDNTSGGEMSHGCQVLVWGGERGPAKYILTHWQARPVRLPNIETPIDKFTDNCHCKNPLIIFFLQFPFTDCENDMTSQKLISGKWFSKKILNFLLNICFLWFRLSEK